MDTRKLTAAGLFQCLIISIMNDMTRLRLEFIVHNAHHKLTFESWDGAEIGIQCPQCSPLTTHHKLTFESWVGIINGNSQLWCNCVLTTAGLVQCLIISIMNGMTRLIYRRILCPAAGMSKSYSYWNPD
eukprot:scaffold12472_cov44-Cyclotella_meneghiniana.AAC.1